MTDPADSGKTALVIVAPASGATIIIQPTNAAGTAVAVRINGKVQKVPTPPSSSPLGHILVYCQAGTDVVKEVSASINNQTVFVTIPAIVFGGSGTNTLSAAGSSANNILVGGPGQDTLTAGRGDDILIGGAGPDLLHAGSGNDILIGGSTIYDANLTALLALMSEWGRADNTSYQQRVADLFNAGSGGLNSNYLLNSQTVLRDSAVNQLSGGSGKDWFWLSSSGKSADVLGGYVATEVATFE
jgi:Ca2+-binding RTX toxin-like protein